MTEVSFPLIFEGAMSTCFYLRHPEIEFSVEEAMLYRPEWIEAIHREYIDAGAQAIKTNTFGLSALRCDPVKEKMAARILRQSIACARAAAQKDTLIFGDLGPVDEPDQDAAADIYCGLIDQFLEQGIDHILIETLPDTKGLQETAVYAKSKGVKTFVVSFAVGPDGYSSAGKAYSRLLEEADTMEDVDWIGLNCLSGPYHLYRLIQGVKPPKKPLIVMPNAGYPTVLGRHTHYGGKPEYFGEQCLRLYEAGVSVLGGCCGTTPDHIRQLAMRLDEFEENKEVKDNEKAGAKEPLLDRSGFWKKWEKGEKIIAVEIDPPANDAIAGFIESVGTLKHSGADLVTIADCPVGRPRADSSLLACKIRRETGMDVLPHMTCRDRNLNAAKALLLGLSIEDIHNVLVITGDPLPRSDFSEVKSVFAYNSRKLASYIDQLSSEALSVRFNIFGALNLNARNFDRQLAMAKEKEAAGMCGFLTQPIHSREALDNLKKARAELKGKILAGIYPVVSVRNARFMNSEINGITVCDEIIDLYEDKSREEAEDIAVMVSAAIAREAADFCDGYYVMTPFSRHFLVRRVIEAIRDTVLER